ncbi:MAG TPA: alginate lyase family protein [Pyrinomonadaceae bacterium]|nr:alginate lyase family protein [Pyrinomonadaceae bacterium]
MNLQKLKNVSFEELRVRAAQRVAAFSERRGWSDLVKLPADDEFISLFTTDKAGATYDLLEHFRLRSEPAFFRSFGTPDKTAAAFQSRWPDTAQRIIEKANRVCAGKFDLLGFTNLDFGNPIDWQFEPISGKRIPLVHWSKLDYLDAEIAGDKKIIWELNRHQYFATLGQAYWLTGDERYAQVFATHLDAWMDANPPKLGINWASSLEVAFRSMAWLWAFYFFKSSPSLNTETFTRAWKFLYLSARHLESYLSTYFSPNTHLTGEALGLFFLGTLLPEFKEAKRWQDLGSEILIDQIPVHVRDDGVYFEQSSYYHRYTTDFYIHFLLLSRANKFTLPVAVEEAVVRLLEHVMCITRPDGTTPLFGDDDGGRLAMLDVRAANDFRGTLATGALLFDRGDYKLVADGAAEELLWLTGSEGLNRFDSIVATQPSETSKAFPEGGYFVMRDGWTNESNYLLFDCGPHGSLACGHAHADALSIDVAANGCTILVDPGTCTYTGSKELRDWFRSSHAHNTVTLDGHSSSAPNGAFSWKTTARCSLQQWISQDRFDFVSGRHDGFMRLESPAMVTREILFLKRDYWIVRDVVSSSKDHRLDVRFHFDSARHTETALDIQCFGRGQWIEEEAFVSHCYGQKERAKAVIFSATLRGGEDVISFLLPRKPGIEWRVTEMEAEEGRAFDVSQGKTRDLVMIRSGQWVWKRFVDGELQEIVSPQTQTLAQTLE